MGPKLNANAAENQGAAALQADQTAAMLLQIQQQLAKMQADQDERDQANAARDQANAARDQAAAQERQQHQDAIAQQMQQFQDDVAQQLAAFNVAPAQPAQNVIVPPDANVNADADANVPDGRVHRKPFKVSGRAPQFCIERDKENFLIWKEDWNCFLFSSGINQLDNQEERNHYAYAHLRSALSMTTKKWIDSIDMDEEDAQNADYLVELLETQVLETSNPTQAMVEVLQKEQRQDESVDDLRMYFNQKQRYCFNGIHDWQDHFMKGAFIKALRSSETRRKLLAQKALSYHECVEFARNEEKAAKDDKFLSGASKTEANFTHKPSNRGFNRGRGGQHNQGGHQQQVQNNSQDRGRSQSKGPQNRGRSPSGNRTSFHKACQTSHQFGSQFCPLKNPYCSKCGKMGHTGDVCRNPTQQNQQPATNSVQQTVGAIQLPTVNEANQDNINTIEKLDLIKVVFQTSTGWSITAESLPDSGANVNLLPLNEANRIGFRGSAPPTGPSLADGSKLDTVGFIFVDLLHNDILIKDVKFLISRDVAKPILSRKVLKKFRLIPEDFPFTQVNNLDDAQPTSVDNTPAAPLPQRITLGHGPELDKIANRYPNVFCDKIRGMTGEPAMIELTPDAQPCSSGAFRDILSAYLEPLKKELDLQVKAGIIEPVQGPTEWLHPIVVVPKKDTSDVRLCVDLRRLNKYAKRPVNPQPTPWELVRNIPKGAKLFAVFDALKGYHQLPLEEGSRSLTTFYTPFGKFRYCSFPMGYAPAGDLFTCLLYTSDAADE